MSTATPPPGDIDQQIADWIAAHGPIAIADYIGMANAHYYATRDPLGRAGDFTTAPEISQMFGELIGLWLADLWQRAGRPDDVAYVELGPGRGTLAADARRSMARAGLTPPVHLVETSPALRHAQRSAVPDATWHDSIDTLPAKPLLLVANEFFDALPIRQLIHTDAGWRERCLIPVEGRFVAVPGEMDVSRDVPDRLQASAPLGAIYERQDVGCGILSTLAGHLARHGGAALIIDYGYAGPALGDTLQAVSAHQFADPYCGAGSRDLTCHVDFTALADVCRTEQLLVSPLASQGAFLSAIGIDARAETLVRANPTTRENILSARGRLVASDQMGQIFKVLAVRHPLWPLPAGFAA